MNVILFLVFLLILYNYYIFAQLTSNETTPLYSSFYEEVDSPIAKMISLSEIVVETNVEFNTNHLIYVYVGNPPQQLKMKLSTAICGMWILDKKTFDFGFAAEDSDSYEDMEIPYQIDHTKGNLGKDDIELCNCKAKQIPFLLVDQIAKNVNSINYDGLIGFGYKCRSKSKGNINIIQKFKEEGRKDLKDMIVYNLNEDGGGLFTIGKYHEEMDPKSKLYHKAPLDDNNTGHWKIKLYSVYFDDGYIINVDNLMSVGFGGNFFSVNKEFFYAFYNKFFLDAESRGLCELRKKDMYEVICDLNFNTQYIGNLNVIVGKFNFKILNEKLFRYFTDDNGNGKLWCAVVYYPEFNQFYISQLLFKQTTLVFNREEGYLGFYIKNQN